MSEIPKCRPRMARWLNWSSALLVNTTSSTKTRTLRVTPRRFKSSCCWSRCAIRATFHSLKKKRGSYQSSSCIFKVGLHDALPTKHTTRSNDVCNRLSRSLTAVDLPCRLPPQSAKLNGIRSRSRSGFQDGSILFS